MQSTGHSAHQSAAHRGGGHSPPSDCVPGLQRAVPVFAGGPGLRWSIVSGAVWPVLAPFDG
jgi:hypothetical protein